MGCVVSRVDREERVVICKERKRVMKQLLGLRAEFANAILSYLRALKNTGGTLKQFTESELLELDSILPPSPPLPLPPSPPLPPPIDSPDLRKIKGKQHVREAEEDIIEVNEENCCTPPPPPLETAWDLCDLLDTSSIQHELDGIMVEDGDEENWAETKSQFEEEAQGHTIPDNALERKSLNEDSVENDLAMRGSGQTKETVNTAMVVWRRKKTLPSIVKELDDYFLKASTGAKEIAVLVDLGSRNASLHRDIRETRGKGNNSTRSLNSLSWNWSSKTPHLTQDEQALIEPCKAGAHCITLEKLYAEEQILYKAVRDEEVAKLDHRRKSLSLQKYENENADLNKIDKTQSAVESLQSDIVRLQELERRACSSILTLIDEQLHPQLVSLLSGVIHMWRTMFECHQVQSHICQQIQHLSSNQSMEPTTEYHREATVQLESEVKFWFNSFCRLAKSQRDYMNALFRWVQLTDCLVDDNSRNRHSSMVRDLCQRWLTALDRLPEKVVSDAIKSFLSVIRSIILQQEEECIMKKKSDRLERRLHKEINSLLEMEKKHEESVGLEDADSSLYPKHPLYIKRAKTEALRNRYENEKGKYASAIQVSRAMTLKNLQTCLPHVFKALMVFSSACTEAFETALNPVQQISNVEQSNGEC
ncbi:protein ALTERED PHOSPHATE STARVATION RESPONSE 1-like [Silene latifolia]|uniref:protein ALTERED PHOSPHATE STARVATION RESPONSE 1-like n=1 Tax=Silene latifolia TaxID=37657 RepID=UPI003D77C81A